MKCERCNSFVNENDQFCNKCGNLIKSSSKQISFDDALIKSFIGSKSDKMYEQVKSGGIIIWSILFGVIYFMYRKMYLVTFLTVVLTLLVCMFIPSIGTYTANIIGLMFCPLYKWDITRKLKKIKANNDGVSNEELLEIAKKQGGVSVVAAVATTSILLIILFAYFMVL